MDACERGLHTRPRSGTTLYNRGKKQAEISIERYHQLCAALQRKYTARPGKDVPISEYGGYTWSVGHNSTSEDAQGNAVHVDARTGTPHTIDFSAYKDFKLKPMHGVRLYPSADGSVHPDDLAAYHDLFEDDWQMQETGIFRALGEPRDFFSCISNYSAVKSAA